MFNNFREVLHKLSVQSPICMPNHGRAVVVVVARAKRRFATPRELIQTERLSNIKLVTFAHSAVLQAVQGEANHSRAVRASQSRPVCHHMSMRCAATKSKDKAAQRRKRGEAAANANGNASAAKRYRDRKKAAGFLAAGLLVPSDLVVEPIQKAGRKRKPWAKLKQNSRFRRHCRDTRAVLAEEERTPLLGEDGIEQGRQLQQEDTGGEDDNAQVEPAPLQLTSLLDAVARIEPEEAAWQQEADIEHEAALAAARQARLAARELRNLAECMQ